MLRERELLFALVFCLSLFAFFCDFSDAVELVICTGSKLTSFARFHEFKDSVLTIECPFHEQPSVVQRSGGFLSLFYLSKEASILATGNAQYIVISSWSPIYKFSRSSLNFVCGSGQALCLPFSHLSTMETVLMLMQDWLSQVSVNFGMTMRIIMSVCML